MKVIAVDDERLAAESLRLKLSHIERISEVHAFTSPEEALGFFAENGADVVFMDISMSQMDGMTLAGRMREMRPGVAVIFTTGYAEYSLDAFKLHADGYLMKPMSESDIELELDDLERRRMPSRKEKRVRVQCFGNFEVFVDEKPLRFERVQTKELLAYLVDRHGASVNTAQLCAVLWENSPEIDDGEQRSKLRHLISDLNRTLHRADADELLIKRRNSFAVDIGTFDCDYYDYTNGSTDAAVKYRGEYMSRYSWAEIAHGALN